MDLGPQKKYENKEEIALLSLKTRHEHSIIHYPIRQCKTNNNNIYYTEKKNLGHKKYRNKKGYYFTKLETSIKLGYVVLLTLCSGKNSKKCC